MSAINKPFFLLPRTAGRLSTFITYSKGDIIPESYLFYGLRLFAERAQFLSSNLSESGANYKFILPFLRILNWWISRNGGYGGDFDQALWGSHLQHKSDCVIAYTGRLAFPLIWMRRLRLVPTLPTLFLTNGLPEKLEHFRNEKMRSRLLTQLNQIELVVTMSKPEGEALKDVYGLTNVLFIPEAVDATYFSPEQTPEVGVDIDVVSIGADKYRDFDLVVEVARSRPALRFVIVTTAAWVDKIRESNSCLPPNLTIVQDIPLQDVRMYLARSRINLVLVRSNSYSGGTTVVLQGMAMGLPTITNKVGSNVDPEFFQDDENIMFVRVGDRRSVLSAIDTIDKSPTYGEILGTSARRGCLQKRTLEIFHNRLYRAFEFAIAPAKSLNSNYGY